MIQSIRPEHLQEKSTCYSKEALKRCVFGTVLNILIVALALILFGSVFQAFATMLAICNVDTSGAIFSALCSIGKKQLHTEYATAF